MLTGLLKDPYDTPVNTPRRWLDKATLNSRIYFFSGFFWRVFQAWCLTKRGRYHVIEQMQHSLDFLQFIEACGGRFHISGLAALPQQLGPFVFVSNHMSSLETAVMPGMIGAIMPVTFVAKSSLQHYPFFGPVITQTKPIWVDRVNPREDFQAVMAQGLDALAKGVSIVIYPQSTRTAVFDPKAFNSMGVKLARRANVPLIPVAVKTDFWATGKYLKDLGPIHRNRPIYFAFGEPFLVDTNSKAAHHQVISFIQTHLEAWTTT